MTKVLSNKLMNQNMKLLAVYVRFITLMETLKTLFCLRTFSKC